MLGRQVRSIRKVDPLAPIIKDMAEDDASKLFRRVEPPSQFPFSLLSASFASLSWAYKDDFDARNLAQLLDIAIRIAAHNFLQILANESRKGGIHQLSPRQ